ncbi:MAG: CorA family divalent cation transporter [Brachymonas sp.]|jgi:magnesium transporter
MNFYQFPLGAKPGKPTHARGLPHVPEPDAQSFLWCVLPRSALTQDWEALQTVVRGYSAAGLLQLHLRDLCNAQHPSRYDFSSDYDVLIFRQLAQAHLAQEHQTLPTLVTAAVGFVLFDQLLITVYEDDCPWVDDFLLRFMQDARLPHSPADLMLRLTNALVDDFLNLRKVLGLRLHDWQVRLLRPNTHFTAWQALLAERSYFSDLASICEEQHDTMQEWLDAQLEQSPEDGSGHSLQRDLLLARSRDIIGHIQRVNQYVSKLETSMENAVQIHFSAQANRANAAMQMLTVIAAIFLPLNFVTGFFGMNFDTLPLIHKTWGVWLAVLAMLMAAAGMAWFFWQKRYWRQHETD